MQMKNFYVIGLASAVAVLSCGKKKSEEAAQQISDAINNALAIGYPDGLSIPTFPQTKTTSSLTSEDGLNLEENDTKGQTLQAKRDDAKKILEGGVEDCFANMKKRLRDPTDTLEKCYEFDQEMIFGHMGDPNTNLKGTKNGLSTKTGSTEVCMVSFARDEMRQIEEMIDQQLDRAQAMACIAKKNGKILPAAAGQSIDIKDDMNAKKPVGISNAPTFGTVTLSRLADKDSLPVYETKVVTTFPDGRSEEMTLTHSPTTADNSEYSGVIAIKRSGLAGDKQGQTAMNMYMSLQYTRKNENGAKKIKASVRRARMATTVTNPFDGDNLVNFSGVADGAANDVVNAISLVEFDVNQTDSTGTLSYWKNPGGSLTEAARGFVFRVEKDTDTTVKGCAISGASFRNENTQNPNEGTSIRYALGQGTTIKPNGWYHPFFQAGTAEDSGDYNFKKTVNLPNGQSGTARWRKTGDGDTTEAKFSKNETGNAVSRQCFKQDADGKYVIDGNFGTLGYELITIGSPNFIQPPDLAAVKQKKMK